MELYRWQKDCLKAWEKNGFRGILHVITGAGKTVAALEGARLLEQKLKQDQPNALLRLRVVVPTIAIARQWVHAVRSVFQEEIQSGEKHVGLWYGEEKDDPDCFCMIYVVNSARHRISGQIIRDMELGHPVMLIADECHHYGSFENRKIFDFRLSPRYQDDLYHAMGLSATPQCQHFEDELVPALGPEIYWYQLSQAIHDGTVSPYVVFQVEIALTGRESEQYGKYTLMINRLYRLLIRQYSSLSEGPFFLRVRSLAEQLDDTDSLPQRYLDLVLARRELCIRAENRISCAVELVRKRKRSERIILFCERIDQAEAVRAALRESMPSQTGMYHSEMLPEKRREVLRDFRDGVIRVLIACKALDEGIDVPDAATGIVLSSTLTDRQRIQRLGRVLRRSSEKQCASLYYLYVGNWVDEGDFLPAGDENQPTADLAYISPANRFESGAYTALARDALQMAREKGADEPHLLELRRCMDQGITEPEWLMPSREVEKILQSVPDREERNLLIALKLISQAREASAEG